MSHVIHQKTLQKPPVKGNHYPNTNSIDAFLNFPSVESCSSARLCLASTLSPLRFIHVAASDCSYEFSLL